MEVTHEKIDIKIPAEAGVGCKIELDQLNYKHVNLRIFKGVSHAEREKFEFQRIIMLRVKVQFLGLGKNVPIDAIVAKETIESIDIDLDLLEIFFNKKIKKQEVTRLFSSIIDKYLGTITGTYLGTIRMTYGEFSELMAFLQYLSYEPLKKEILI